MECFYRLQAVHSCFIVFRSKGEERCLMGFIKFNLHRFNLKLYFVPPCFPKSELMVNILQQRVDEAMLHCLKGVFAKS